MCLKMANAVVLENISAENIFQQQEHSFFLLEQGTSLKI